MRIVVIGGTGLIGSQVVQGLTERGHDAVAAAPSTGVMVPATMSSDLLALDELPWVEVVFSGALARASGVDALVAAGVDTELDYERRRFAEG